MEVIFAPNEIPIADEIASKVFLAGSIDMGLAEEWQSKLIEDLSPRLGDYPVIFMNPRRPDWDSSWHQDSEELKTQIEWELSALESSDIIFYYFAHHSKAPITLLELGLFANTNADVIVFCPREFYRWTNVNIVCDRYGCLCLDNYKDALTTLEAHIRIF